MRRGFTILELMVCVAIMLVLAAVVVPVVSRAKRASGQAVATSNLRQCYLALSLYDPESNDWKTVPTRDVAWRTLEKGITDDPGDTWRKPGVASPYRSMLGSFGYANAEICMTPKGDPRGCVGAMLHGRYPLLVSIFRNDPPIPPAEYVQSTLSPRRVLMPEKGLTLWTDGSVRLEPVPEASEHRLLFSWGALFALLNSAGVRR